jgi:phytoene synthase
MKLLNHNELLVRAQDTNFYYSFAFLPPEKRRAIEAVHAFARRCDDAVDGQLSPADAARALAACRRDLDLCYPAVERAGQRPTGRPQVAALVETVARFNIPRQLFEDLLTGLEMDLSITRYETFDDLSVYCYRVASTIGLMAVEVFGYRNASARQYAVHLGTALQLVNILRDLGPDARRGRLYLPLEDLRRFEVEPESLLRGQPVGRFDALMRFEVGRARNYFRLARQKLPIEDRRSLIAAEMMAAIYWKILARIAEREGHGFEERVRLSRWNKIWTVLSVYLGFDWYKAPPDAEELDLKVRE